MKFDVGDLITFTYYYNRFPSTGLPSKGSQCHSTFNNSTNSPIPRRAIVMSIDYTDGSATVLLSNNDERLKEYAVYEKDIIKVISPYNKLIEGL